MTKAQELAEQIWSKLEKFTSKERKEFFEFLGDQWCIHCGSVRKGYCHCRNDE